jgi:hypothetical protein
MQVMERAQAALLQRVVAQRLEVVLVREEVLTRVAESAQGAALMQVMELRQEEGLMQAAEWKRAKASGSEAELVPVMELGLGAELIEVAVSVRAAGLAMEEESQQGSKEKEAAREEALFLRVAVSQQEAPPIREVRLPQEAELMPVML